MKFLKVQIFLVFFFLNFSLIKLAACPKMALQQVGNILNDLNKGSG